MENILTADLGSGTGTFTGGILYLGGNVTGFEIDSKYAEITYQ
jgi:predicted RNA methylase